MARQQKSRFRFFNLLSDFAQIILILGLIAVAILSFGARIPILAQLGLRFFAVVSGSMEPAIPTGAVIKVKSYNLADLKKGDVITYQIPTTDASQPVIVTHRIHEINKQEKEKMIGEGENQEKRMEVSYEFSTKGDANNSSDQYIVQSNDIIGLYDWHLPYLGYVTNFSHTSSGFLLMVILPAVILIVWEVVSLILHFKQSTSVKSELEIKKLKQEISELKKQDD